MIEFYDNQADPPQTADVAADPRQAAAIAKCEAHLQRLMDEVDIAPAELPRHREPKHHVGPWAPDIGNPNQAR